DLRPREVRVDHETRALADQALVAVAPELLADRRCLPALPDDRRVDRTSALAIPDDCRLALVRDSDRAELPRAEARGGTGLAGHARAPLPDPLGIVLHPAGLGIALADLGVGAAEDRAVPAEDEGRRPGRPLIDRQPRVRHGTSLGSAHQARLEDDAR